MVQVYSQVGLNDPVKAVRAQEIITEARPKDSTFATLAVLAYQAGQTRKGDLATKEALSLADEDDRNTLKSELETGQAAGDRQPAPGRHRITRRNRNTGGRIRLRRLRRRQQEQPGRQVRRLEPSR